MRTIHHSIIACSLFISIAAHSEGTPVALPRVAERLPQTISMSECSGVRIVEWRGTPQWSFTNKSDDGIRVIEKACKLAYSRYPSFLIKKNLSFTEEPFLIDVALMPANTLVDGKFPRNLNDTSGRFKTVQPNCCSWGIYDAPTSFLFLRNDPIYIHDEVTSTNKYFVRTFLHEFAHVMNHKWHVKERNFPNNDVRDEELAEEWVSYLGIQFRTESSSEDYFFKANSNAR